MSIAAAGELTAVVARARVHAEQSGFLSSISTTVHVIATPQIQVFIVMMGWTPLSGIGVVGACAGEA